MVALLFFRATAPPSGFPNLPIARPLLLMAVDAELARVDSRQMPIFPRGSSAVCEEIKLTPRDARKLHQDGLLSFDPAGAVSLDESRETELVFLGSLVANGCSRPLLRHLLANLRPPYCYDIRRVFYEWRTQQWRLLPGEADPEGAFFDMLERLRDRREVEALLNLRDWLDEALDLAHDRTMIFAHSGNGIARGAGPRDTD